MKEIERTITHNIVQNIIAIYGLRDFFFRALAGIGACMGLPGSWKAYHIAGFLHFVVPWLHWCTPGHSFGPELLMILVGAILAWK